VSCKNKRDKKWIKQEEENQEKDKKQIRRGIKSRREKKDTNKVFASTRT